MFFVDAHRSGCRTFYTSDIACMLYVDESVGLVHMPRDIQRLQAPRNSPGLNATASLTRSKHRRFLHACEDDVNEPAAKKSVAPSSQLLDSKVLKKRRA
ncbi:hypothetical protein BJX62DRAFT_205596 [Aspergillus germanicus]